MATQAFANPAKTARVDNAPGQGSYLLDTALAAADVDLTLVTSPTGGLCARIMRIDVAGNLKFAAIDGSIDTYTVLAGEYVDVTIAYVFKTGTTATGIHAIT